MAVVSFEPNTKIIEVTDAPPANNIQELDFQVDVYSEAKRQWLSTPSLRKHRFPIKAIGGDAITDVQNLGTTYFLLDGWKLRAYNQSGHRLLVIGNISTQTLDGGFDADEQKFDFVGGVQVENQVSNIVDSSVARLDLAQLLEAVYIDTSNGEPGTDEGVGTPTRPVDNIADARVIADRENLRGYVFFGTLTLDQDYSNWRFSGIAAEPANLINLNGQNVNNSKFLNCQLDGAMTGVVDCIEVGFQDVTGFDGVARRCGIKSSVTLAAFSTTVFHDCFSEVAGIGQPTVDLNAGMDPIAGCNVRSYTGGITVENVNHADESISIDLDGGRCVIDASCTDGVIVVGGMGTLANNSAGTTVYDYSLVDAEKITRILDLIEGDEAVSSTEHIKYLKNTFTILMRKAVTGSTLTAPITLTDTTP